MALIKTLTLDAAVCSRAVFPANSPRVAKPERSFMVWLRVATNFDRPVSNQK